MSTFSFKLDDEKIARIRNDFADDIKDPPNEYVAVFIKKEDLTITAYRSGKVVFQGEDAFAYAQHYLEVKRTRQAGSDEVGTGDVFGPVAVCAAIVEEDDYDLIAKLQITDSKQLTDEHIRQIGPDVMAHFKHSLLILDNARYNRVHETENLNSIKAKMHNKAYLNMIAKGYQIPKAAYVDQFCAEDLYYRYLVNEKEVYHDLIFETKAEEKYPAVAIGSIISRFAFLSAMDKLENHYRMRIPKGSSDTKAIDDFIQAFIARYGKDELKNIGKLHFKNFERYL